MNLTKFRNDFPALVHSPGIYLDSAATSLKPTVVAQTIADWYMHKTAPIYRSIYAQAESATKEYERVREDIARFLNVQSREIVFTKNSTEAINLVATSWVDAHLKAGDEILLTELEHHANLLPWLQRASQQGIVLRFLPVTIDGMLDLSAYQQLLSERTKFVAVTASSNVLGDIDDLVEDNATSFLTKLIHDAHAYGARVLVDAAQWIPHNKVDISMLGADFVVFSAHKMLGPTGVGILYTKYDEALAMNPYQYGGGMVASFDTYGSIWRNPPHCFEAGTPASAEVVGFGAALTYIQQHIDYAMLQNHEAMLCSHLIEGLSKLSRVRVLGPVHRLAQRGHLVSFTIDGLHAHDIAAYLDRYGIAVRAGDHCAQLLHKKLAITNSVRVSFYGYNNHNDVELLLKHLKVLHSL